MSATTTPVTTETQEAHELLERAMKLPPGLRQTIALELLDSVNLPEDTTKVKNAWRDEIARRIEAVRNGTMKLYSLEETMDYLQKVVDEGRRP